MLHFWVPRGAARSFTTDSSGCFWDSAELKYSCERVFQSSEPHGRSGSHHGQVSSSTIPSSGAPPNVPECSARIIPKYIPGFNLLTILLHEWLLKAVTIHLLSIDWRRNIRSVVFVDQCTRQMDDARPALRTQSSIRSHPEPKCCRKRCVMKMYRPLWDECLLRSCREVLSLNYLCCHSSLSTHN